MGKVLFSHLCISLTPLVETKSPRIWTRGGAPSSDPRTFRFYQRGDRDNLDLGRDCKEIRGSLIGISSRRGYVEANIEVTSRLRRGYVEALFT